MKNILVDTDVIINFSKGKDRELKELLEVQESGNCELFINPVIQAEYFTDRNLLNKEKMQKAISFFSFFTMVDIDRKVGFKAGELLREGKVQFIGDAFIAATCLIRNLFLKTANRKHFTKIKELELY